MKILSDKVYKYGFAIVLAIFIICLLFVANSLSISYKEALNVFDNTSVLTLVTFLPLKIFGFNDIALRLPFILFYASSAYLMYLLTKGYFKYESDRLINVILFMLLPGVLSASLLVNTAIIVTFFTLLYLYYYKTYGKHNYYLLVLFLFIDNSFAVFFLALFFYALNKKENQLFIVSLILFGLSMYIYGFETSGKPKGYLLDLFAIYGSIFSPLLFIYFFYAMYRIGIKGNRSLYWYISVTALVFSFLFSIRQKVYIEDFAPYVVITLPLMLKLFFHTFRVRLPEFRGMHRKLAFLVVALLAINVLLTVVNKPLYLLLAKPQKHFAYKYHFAKEIATILKEEEINEVFSDDYQLTKRLQFYNITSGNKFLITFNPYYKEYPSYSVSYYDKEILTFYIVPKQNLLGY